MTLVAACQLAPKVGDVVGNRAAIEAAVRAAAAGGARLVVLPELSDSGYVFASADEARALAEPVDSSATLELWSALATELDVVIVGGWCERGADGALYNSAAVVGSSGVLATYRKTHLWDAEKLYFTPGELLPPVVDTAVGRVAVCICYDLEFFELTRPAALAGTELLAVPTNWPLMPRPEGERPAEVVKAQAVAASNAIWVVAADRCGTERDVPWIGGSTIVSPAGYPVAGPVLDDHPAILVAEVDMAAAHDKQITTRNHLLEDRRLDLYG